MQLPAQNPPGFASDWGSLSEPSHWSSSVGSSANQGAASGARGGLAIPIRFMVPKFSTARGQIWGRGLRHPICYSLQLVAPGGRLLRMTALTQISQDFKNFKSVNKKFSFCDLHLQQWNINVCWWNKARIQTTVALLVQAGFETMILSMGFVGPW